MPIAIMANRNEQSKPVESAAAERVDRRTGLENPVQKMQREGREEKERAAAAKRAAEAQKASAQQMETIHAKMRGNAAASPESAPAVSTTASKKGMFSRLGNWFKSAFEPSVEERSAAHAKTEAEKNPLVAQQMRDMESAAPIGKAEFKRMMKEEEKKIAAAKRLDTTAKKAQELVKGGSNEFMEYMAEGESAADAVAMVEAHKRAEASVRREKTKAAINKVVSADLHGMGMNAVDATATAIEKGGSAVMKGGKRAWNAYMDAEMQTGAAKAERIIAANRPPQDAELAEMIALGEDPADAAEFLAAKRRNEAKARKEKPGYASTALSGIMKGAQYVREQTKYDPTVTEALDKSLAWTEKQLVGPAGIVERAVQGTGKPGEVAGKAAEAFFEAGPKALEKGFDLKAQAEKATEEFLAKDWEKTKARMAERLEKMKRPLISDELLEQAGVARKGESFGPDVRPSSGGSAESAEEARLGVKGGKALEVAKGMEAAIDMATRAGKRALGSLLETKRPPAARDMNEAAWVQGLQKGDEDVPDEIAEVVAETASEREQGPQNFIEVFDDMKDLAESDNRTRKAAFLAEAEILEGMAEKNADPKEYLGAIGDKFRGWSAKDVKRLVDRLYKTNLLAK